MNNDINDKTILWAILLTSLMLNVYLLTREEKTIEKEVVEYVEKKDTVVTIKKQYDTVFVSKTEYVPKIINDTVYIRDISHEYRFNNSDYDLYVNAVKLNNYKLDIHAKDTITLYETIKQPIYITKEKKFQHGISVGLGYGLINKKPDLFLGYSVIYKF